MFHKAATRRVVVARPAGIHARPSLVIAQTVARFRSQVQIQCDDRKADARSILDLLSLGAGQGQELVLTANGPDEEQVLDALEQCFQNDFGLSEE
jgi:phosphotransferase system HPr (HPr) family protein